ncbi:MAG: TIGR01459 family HAD-type hydrolase [Paracoccaceae bacterium]
MTRQIDRLSQIASEYDAAFVDLWGCVHDGLRAHAAAVEALQVFRAGGGRVVLVTNAPRTRASVERQITALGIPDDAWDAIATSGDSARAALHRGAVGRRVYFIGEARDMSFFDPPDIVADPVEIERVALEEAEGIVCTGPTDVLADPSVWRPQFLVAKQRGLKLLCANPDIVVDRGETREWCAGALAALYTEMGGESLYFGKPHPPIYDLARRRLAETGRMVEDARILAIGDGLLTDVRGALGEDIDSLFLAGGLAAAEAMRADGTVDMEAVARLSEHAMVSPTYAMGMLR